MTRESSERRGAWRAVALAVAAACGGPKVADRADSALTVAVIAAPAVYDSTAPCPTTGHWAACVVMERLKRAGFDVLRDSALAREAGLDQPGMRLRLGRGAVSVFLYADSVQRRRDEAHLDATAFLSPDAESTPHGRTLLHTDNLLAIMDVPNGRTRERIADALLGGPPQPARR